MTVTVLQLTCWIGYSLVIHLLRRNSHKERTKHEGHTKVGADFGASVSVPIHRLSLIQLQTSTQIQ